tara:strand:- start:557 stop:718 length:162 start_codon:yes stop_codon:yes gene_type:complete
MSREFVNSIVDDNKIEAEDHFKTALASKVGDALELKRREISKSFVGNQVAEEE